MLRPIANLARPNHPDGLPTIEEARNVGMLAINRYSTH
jgi:hypothetical protein